MRCPGHSQWVLDASRNAAVLHCVTAVWETRFPAKIDKKEQLSDAADDTTCLSRAKGEK